MKILVICQHYYPEPFRITDICEQLVQNGHEVTVVTGLPNYPMGHIYDGYRNGKKRDECINGVNVHRCFTIGRRSGAVWRFLNYYSFMLSSTDYTSGLREEYDVVFVNQLSPVMMAEAGIKYKKKHGTKLVLYCLDLWPESLAVGGIKKGSFIFNIFHKISKRIYKSADKILVTSTLFTEYLNKQFGIKKEDIEYLPQYSENIFSADTCQKNKDEYTDFMFAGNVGAGQSVDTIVKAAALTKEDKYIRWHIVGDGSELENCKRLAESLGADNVIFHGRKPVEAMPEYYAMADVMVVTILGESVIALTLPGKVQTYMAAGKPILVSSKGETNIVIEDAKCGICCPPNDAEALANAAKKIAKSDQLEIYAKNAVEYNETNFSKEKFFKKLEIEFYD
ncbi:MAG: glycosyltransferase family 4 protein [Ruminococcaceae bacterium]|nr:glycosyltransferase family 4 protein [Oscillospiraceae bacterium]